MKIISKWRLKDVVTITIISFFLGMIFLFFDWIYTFAYAVLAGFGLGPLVGEILFGLWSMGGPLAYMIVRLPGSALFSETVGAAVESLAGGQFGMLALIAGFFQGFGSELGFALFKYKKFSLKQLLCASICSTIITFASALYIHSYIKLKFDVLITFFSIRLLSNLVFSVGLVYLIWRSCVKAGLINEN
ncbi:cobalt ABC transporter permease [Oenococcus sp. UCMA 16435]|nr:cobalt ABC transporter permease [Oenococcus sp. UCMA 16435]MDI4584279.1 cobalt ABC transporter permease [Oenococcus sp. UCMA 14587]MDN6967026.1 cobalt ABC transporter permease [Oenococcus sp. UCMA 17063]